ncbi:MULTISPECIES: ribulose-phosphate 3-epimerase [unclassified Thermoanaerobacterium]|jgi:ribulose-phosphate 3-epimerase|uniref:ribulose-phosphate 3-epimerase n=1 Tax=unclassified Thermoanaerobacterium TaxID=2622527 RepID=UPI0005ED8787|nr:MULTISPECIES: ribulose-phosphate 3-epimerase [unclassified Thermoanaerobacterium]MDE4541894.1 ribulose-phosphate 3-epimerase [Thermoanaerobacterium sp. R66]ORX24297.1 ribulose-phosphate 3-epimerase [Thermoanaerobacterium sp. PSU-2]HHV73313.1 ribulose-phosphate 3-epimerase [Thermoanaerobacterium sp.]
MEISPSILSADFGNLLSDIRKVEVEKPEYLHIDIMDGHFVPNITIGPLVLNALKGKTKIPFDVHLMIEEPDKYVKEFVDAGAKNITVHQEACVHLDRTLQLIKSMGINASVALNPATSLDTLRYVLSSVDMVLIMTVNPGFGGQVFIDGMYEKIRELASIRNEKGLNFKIEVDGGINIDNIKDVVLAGADVIVAGSFIFANGDPGENLKKLREAALK